MSGTAETVANKFHDIRNSSFFKSFETKLGSAVTNVCFAKFKLHKIYNLLNLRPKWWPQLQLIIWPVLLVVRANQRPMVLMQREVRMVVPTMPHQFHKQLDSTKMMDGK
jgi:hypothetical protein